MSLSMKDTCNAIRSIVAEIAAESGIQAVYSAGESDIPYALPPALNETPAVLVYPGQTLSYLLSSGQQRHTYEVRLDVVESAGGDIGIRAATTLPLVDAVMAKFLTRVTLNGTTNYAQFSRQSGLADLQWGSLQYTGYEISLEVSEQGPATPQP